MYAKQLQLLTLNGLKSKHCFFVFTHYTWWFAPHLVDLLVETSTKCQALKPCWQLDPFHALIEVITKWQALKTTWARWGCHWKPGNHNMNKNGEDVIHLDIPQPNPCFALPTIIYPEGESPILITSSKTSHNRQSPLQLGSVDSLVYISIFGAEPPGFFWVKSRCLLP